MKKLLVIFAIAASATVATANDSSSGCGLGWEVFKETSLVSSLLRSTTNAVASNTIAMTLGTSGCAKHSIVDNKMESLHYAEANFHNLMVEMAQGQGQFVEAFAQTLGCQGAEKEFSSEIQKNYATISAASSSPANMLTSVQREVANNASLSLNCRI